MTHIATRIFISFLFVYGSHAQAQYSIQPVAELGVVKTKYLHFDPERNNWLLSDGYSVWEADKDFLKTKLLYNTFPGYQYEIDRLPNGNIFNRQFDYTASIFNRNTHYNKLDSASIFITNSQKQAKINPASFLKVRKWASGFHAQFWAMSNCFTWGTDSTTLCRESMIMFSKTIAGRDSSVTYHINETITAFEVDNAGSIALAGTKDSGWYFISENTALPYLVKPLHPGNRVANFFINHDQKQIWVQEEAFAPNLVALRLYDYSSGLPILLKDLPAADLGISSGSPLLSFDWENKKLYVQSGNLELIKFDLISFKPEQNFFGLVHQSGIQSIDAMHISKKDGKLYLATSKLEEKTQTTKQYIILLDIDESKKIPVIIAKNDQDKNQFYKQGMHTVTGETKSSFSTNVAPTLSANGLAIIPVNQSTYQLYDLPAAKVIQSFQSLTAATENGYNESGKPYLSPQGKYIFEILTKNSLVYNLPDSFSLALVNLQDGTIARKLWVPQRNAYDPGDEFYWSKDDLPVFIIKKDTHRDSIWTETFYFDEQLNERPISSVKFLSKPRQIIYEMRPIGESGNFYYRSNSPDHTGQYDYYVYQSKDNKEKLLHANASDMFDFYGSAMGFLLVQETETDNQFHWHDKTGNLIHTTTLKSNTYGFNSLIHDKPTAYLFNKDSYKIARLNLITGEVTGLEAKTEPALDYIVSPDEKYILSKSENNEIWQIEGDRIFKLNQPEEHKNFIKQTQFNPNYLVSDGRIWNLRDGMLQISSLSSIAFVNDSIYLSTESPNSLLENSGLDENFRSTYKLIPHENNFIETQFEKVDLFNWAYSFNKQVILSKHIQGNRVKNIYALPFSNDNFSEIKIYPTPDKQYALIIKERNESLSTSSVELPQDTAVLLNLNTGKTSVMLSGNIQRVYTTKKDLTFFVQDVRSKKWELYYTASDKIKIRPHKINFNTDTTGIGYVMDEQHIARLEENGLTIWNIHSLETKRIPFRYSSENYIESSYLFYDINQDRFFIGYSDGGIVRISQDKVDSCSRAVESIAAIIGKQHNYILMMDKKGDYHFIHEQSLEADLHLYTAEGLSFTHRKYLWLTKENYYMASPGAENHIHFAENRFVVPLKQADITYNRPDKVLAYLKAPQKNIELYSRLHQLREKKYSGAGSHRSVPIQINVQNTISKKSIQLQVDASAEMKLHKISITVNGCPFPVELEKPGTTISQQVSIPLNAGKNIVYCWVEDANGNRSRMVERTVTGEFEDEGKWYFLGIGVSQYKDSKNDLRYADKDIRDISNFLVKKYPCIEIDTLLNEAVTVENIQEKMKKYRLTNPDDKIIISISGHGLLDSAKQFWYASHDIDFSNPAKRGLSISMLTDLFSHVPARYRLVTLDACHSGDVLDVTGAGIPQAKITYEDSTIEGIKGNVLLGKKSGDRPSSALLTTMQLLFSDQLSHTGINLLAASSGTEFALEGNQWGNGVFTHVLLEGWAYAAREKSYDSPIHYRNLKNYVQQRVSELTGGRQTPNTLMENGEIDWWLVE